MTVSRSTKASTKRADKVYSFLVSSFTIIAALSCAIGQGPPGDQRPAQEINQVVDMVVAEVDKRIVTLSELLAETRLVLLRQAGPAQARTAAIRRPLLMAVLRSIIARNLLLGEAKRLNLSALPAENTDRVLRSIRGLFANRGEYVRFLEQFGFDIGPEALSSASAPIPPLLADIIRSELEVERFVTLRIHSSLVVSEDDIRECYLDQVDVFGGQALNLVRERIAEALREFRAEHRLVRLVTQLRKKAKVRFTSNFKAEGPLLDVSRSGEGVELRCPEMRKKN
jgi:hypothetical protein